MDNDDNPTGTGKWYKTGRINVSARLSELVEYENGQELIISYNTETKELCLKPLKY